MSFGFVTLPPTRMLSPDSHTPVKQQQGRPRGEFTRRLSEASHASERGSVRTEAGDPTYAERDTERKAEKAQRTAGRCLTSASAGSLSEHVCTLFETEVRAGSICNS